MKNVKIKINDFVDIKNKKGVVDKNNPNCEGRIVDIIGDVVYITNANMPFMGTYHNRPFKMVDIVERKQHG